MSHSASMISSPRQCAFSVPLMGDPFNPVGFLKAPATSYGRRDMALQGMTNTSNVGGAAE